MSSASNEDRTPPSPEPDPPPLRSMRGLLIIACVFTTVGGFLDAYSYLAHGHIFANAQTGNVVLFGVYASSGDWVQALRAVPPILAFMAGVALARILRVRSTKTSFHATLICQSLELLVLLFLASFADRLPNISVVPLLSFVAALQNVSFSTVGPWSFNSAMTTGNIRDAVSGLVQAALGEADPKLRGEAVVSGLVFLCFATGALFGGLYTRYDEKHSLIPCALLVFLGMLLTLRERRRLHPSLKNREAAPQDGLPLPRTRKTKS